MIILLGNLSFNFGPDVVKFGLPVAHRIFSDDHVAPPTTKTLLDNSEKLRLKNAKL